MISPAIPTVLFTLQFLVSACLYTLITLTVGPLASEGLPTSLATSATGLVVCFGEMAGGGLAPMLGGFVATRFGIAHFIILPLAATLAGLITFCFLTRPGVDQTRSDAARLP